MLPMDISSLEKSVAALERAANFLAETHPNNPMREQVRGAVALRFKNALALCLAAMRRHATAPERKGDPPRDAREILRVARENGLIDDAKRWMAHCELRGVVNCTYDEAKAEQVAAGAVVFLADAKAFAARLTDSCRSQGPLGEAELRGTHSQAELGSDKAGGVKLILILDPGDRTLARRILRAFAPQCEAWVFGSRATGRNVRKSSDLDIALVSDPPMGWSELEDLRDIFSASNLPMRTDLVTLDSLPPLVRRNVEAEHVVLRRVNPADIAAAEND